MKGWKKLFQANGAWEQARVAIFICDKADFKQKLDRRGREAHIVLMKGTAHREEMTIENIYTEW
jgi:hypothetical protein